MTAAQLTLRRDLVFSQQETGHFVVKEPNSERFFRIGEVEHFVARQFDGATPLDTVRRRVEERFGASLTTETLRKFIEKLQGRGLLERDASSVPIPHHARGRIRGNPLYLRLKAFDPDRALEKILRKTRWLFTPAFASLCAIGFLVALGITLANAAEIAHALGALSIFESLLLAWLTLVGFVAIH